MTTASERRRVLRLHVLTPGGWECDGPHEPGDSPLWQGATCGWNDCPEIRRVLTPAEHEALMMADSSEAVILVAQYGSTALL